MKWVGYALVAYGLSGALWFGGLNLVIVLVAIVLLVFARKVVR